MAKVKVEKITIVHAADTNPDLSYLGEFTDKPQDNAMIREGEHAGKFIHDLKDGEEYPSRGRNCRFIIPYAGGEAPDYRKNSDYRKYAA